MYKGILWQRYHGALIPKVAPHIDIKLSQEDEKYLLKKSNAYFLRYVTQWDTKESEFWYIIKDKEEGLEQYKSKIRNQIKKGLKNCLIKHVDAKTIAQEGYEAYVTAFRSYNTHTKPYKQEEFYENHIKAKGYDYFAIYEKQNNKMIGYSSNTIQENMVNYVTIKFHPEYLNLYSSYALFYEMNKYYINEKKYLYVNDGARSISHDTNIQEFLIQKFNFRKAYCILNIVYRWDIGLIVKILYPIRKLFNRFNRISTLLKQEEIRRSYE